MGSVRVAIVGVGNCATSLIQGVEYYKDADPDGTVPGSCTSMFGDYHVSDVEFVAAFDVDAKKVGMDLSEAINASENNTIKIADVPPLGVDGAARPRPSTVSASTTARPSRSPTPSRSTSSQVLKDAQADVLVSYLPVGSEQADKFYAQCAIDAGVAFVNALPVFIASDPVWAKKFEDAGVPIVGDDIKSQVGATITHRVMAKLFEDRGVVLDRTYQLNVGGNMDFKNMLERERLESKKISKTQAVTSNLRPARRPGRDRNVHIGPSDYVAWLDDRKWAYVRLEGRAFGDVPLNLEYKLEVWDSPNSAGIIIDAIRAAKIAKDRGIGGPIISASSYLMKSPPVQLPDDEGRAASRPSSPESDLRGLSAEPSNRRSRPRGRRFVVLGPALRRVGGGRADGGALCDHPGLEHREVPVVERRHQADQASGRRRCRPGRGRRPRGRSSHSRPGHEGDVEQGAGPELERRFDRCWSRAGPRTGSSRR